MDWFLGMLFSVLGQIMDFLGSLFPEDVEQVVYRGHHCAYNH